MKVVALGISMLLCSAMAAENDEAQRYAQRLQVAEKEREALKEQVIKTLGAKKDVAGSVREKILGSLRLQTAPPSMPDPFRDEFMPLLDSIIPPEEFCWKHHVEPQGHPFVVSLPKDILDSLNEALLPLKRCAEKWQALAAHGERFLLAVNQTVWRQKEWDDFISRISKKISDVGLTSDDLLEIYNQLSYFHNQISLLTTSHETFLEKLKEGSMPVQESLSYLIEAYRDLASFYNNRARILWEILKNTTQFPFLQKEYGSLDKGFFSKNDKEIKELLLTFPEKKDEQSSLPPISPATPNRVLSQPPSTPSVPPTRTLLASLLSRSMPMLPKKSPTPTPSSTPSSPAPSPLKERETGTMSSMSSLDSGSESSESGWGSGSESHEPEDLNASKKRPNNKFFLQELKRIFSQPALTNVEEFRKKAGYLINIKFILNDLGGLYRNYNTLKNQIISNNDKIGAYLTPRARILIEGDKKSTIIFQSRAYKICTLESSGALCFGLPNSEKMMMITIEAKHTENDLVFTHRQSKYFFPFRIGENLGLSHLEHLFGIHSAPSTLLTVDGIRIFSKESQESETNDHSRMARDYLQNSQPWTIDSTHNFVMAQQKINTDQLFNDWMEKVTSGERSFDEICPFSYGALTLFSLLTQSKAEEPNFSLKTKDDKLWLQRHGFNFPFYMIFQAHKDENQENLQHRWRGHNILYLLPYAKQKIPDDVKKNFTENNIELICAYWLTFLQERQLSFNDSIEKYNLSDQDRLGDHFDLVCNQAKALGLYLSASLNIIEILISNFHQMRDLLKDPNITYFGILQNLRPYEAAMYDVFEARARKSIQRQQPQIFFETLMPTKINQLRHLIFQMKLLEIAPHYSLEEVGLIEEATKNSLKTLEHKKGLSLDDLLSQIDPKVQKFFQSQYAWATQTGFFEVIVGKKAYDLSVDEPVYLYENLIQEISSPPRFSWDTVPIFKSLGIPDYYASILEASRSVADMIQDLFDHCDLSAMPPASAIKIADLLLNLNSQPSHYHESWRGRLLTIADQHYFSLPLIVREFIEGIEEFTLNRKIRARDYSQLQRVGDYGRYLTEVSKKLQFSPSPEESQKLLPSYLFRQLLTLGTQPPQNSFFLTALGDLLLLPFYSSLNNSPDDIEKDPGSLGLASNPIGKRGIWEIHPQTGKHYLLTWCESFVPLFESPDFLSDNVRSILASHPLPLLFLNWLNRLKEFCPETTFHPWYIEKLIEKSQYLQDLMRSRLDITFNDILSTLWPEIHFAMKKEFEAQKLENLRSDFKRDIVELVLKSIHKSRHNLNRVIDSRDRENLKKLNPIENPIDGKDVNLNKTTRNGKNIHALLQEWNAIYEKGERDSAVTGLDEASVAFLNFADPITVNLDEAATLFLNHFNPADFGPEIIARTLFQASQFKINLKKINPDNWKDAQILKNLSAVQAPQESLQLAATLRANKPITLDFPLDHRELPFLTVSGVEGDAELLSDLISLFPDTVTLNISHNSLRSLWGIMPCLKGLSQLRSLNLSGNPIHNPAPLSTLPRLTTLDVSNTYIHPLPKLIPPAELLTSFLLKNLGVNRLDIRLLIRPNFLQTLISQTPAGQELNPEALVSSCKEKIPLSNLDNFVSIPNKGSDHEDRENYLNAQADSFLTRLGDFVRGTPDKRDDIVCILERLAEMQWDLTLTRNLEGDKNRTKEGNILREIRKNSDALFGILESCDHRVSAVKLAFALKFGLPVGAVPNSLAFHAQYPMNQINSLVQLEISNHRPHKDFFGRLPEFINLNALILSDNKNPNILNELPRLPQLTRLDITGYQLSSLNGLHDQSQWPKFENLKKFNVSGNAITSGSHPLYNGIIFLKEMVRLSHLDLSNNSLTEMLPLTYQSLNYLDLRQNKIKDFRGVTEVSDHHQKRYRFLKPQKK